MLKKTRAFRNLIEPIAAAIYFDEPSREALARLGLSYDAGYVCGRAASFGRISPEVVASALATIHPARIRLALEEGWSKTSPEVLEALRRRLASELLARLIHPSGSEVSRAVELLIQGASAAPVAGHPLFAALRGMQAPDDPLASLWWATNVLREHRGDSHTVAWTSVGLRAVDIHLLTGFWLGRPAEERMRTRGWTAVEISESRARLEARELIDGNLLTLAGRDLRENIEEVTDRQEDLVLSAWSEPEYGELAGLMTPWAEAIVQADALPADIMQHVPS